MYVDYERKVSELDFKTGVVLGFAYVFASYCIANTSH